MSKTFFTFLTGLAAGLLIAGAVWLAASPPRGEPVSLLPPPTPPDIQVYVTGAVIRPGVYALPPGSRVKDAVDAAGGFLPIADEDSVNLASLLQDGDHVEIPREAFDASSESLDRININQASAQELDTLPGIGPSLAEEIVSYRRQYGSFQKIEDIMGVPGIGPATFERIKDYITTGY
jgi:competence protein ComEA